MLLEVLSEVRCRNLIDEDVQSHEGIHLRFFEESQLFLKLIHVEQVIWLVALEGFYFEFRLRKFDWLFLFLFWSIGYRVEFNCNWEIWLSLLLFLLLAHWRWIFFLVHCSVYCPQLLNLILVSLLRLRRLLLLNHHSDPRHDLMVLNDQSHYFMFL